MRHRCLTQTHPGVHQLTLKGHATRDRNVFADSANTIANENCLD
jgi:hypothetical protein